MINVFIAIVIIGVVLIFTALVINIAFSDTETFRAIDERIAERIRGADDEFQEKDG